MLDAKQIESVRAKVDKLVSKYTVSKPQNQPKVPAVAIGLTTNQKTEIYKFNGVLDLNTQTPIDENSIFGYFSLTKTITAFAVLKLIEQNKLQLEDEARKFVPEIDDIYIVDKGTVDNKTGEFLQPPRKPHTKVTIKHLLTMTAGLSYGFLNKEYDLLAKLKNPHVNSGNPSMRLFKTDKSPLICEPGVMFSYGHSIDWLGFIVETISKQSLRSFLKQELFDPVGMTTCTFHVKDTTNLVKLWMRKRDGKLHPYPQGVQLDPAIDMGGQGCFGSIIDFLKLLRVWLNYGYCPDTDTRVLREDLCKYALENHLPPGITVKFELPGVPDIPDGFSLAGMAVTQEQSPTGKPVGTLYWSGLANLYYWIDHENKLAGVLACQILPMADSESLLSYYKFEMAVYDAISGEEGDEDEEEDDEEEEEEEEESKSKL